MNTPHPASLQPPATPELEAFQAQLLELLASSLSPPQILERLRSDPAFTPYREYTAHFELRMVEVAAELTKKWGRREAGISEMPGEDTAVNYTP